MGTGKPAIGTVFSWRDAPPDTCPGLACKENVGEGAEVMNRLRKPAVGFGDAGRGSASLQIEVAVWQVRAHRCGADATLGAVLAARLESSLTMSA